MTLSMMPSWDDFVLIDVDFVVVFFVVVEVDFVVVVFDVVVDDFFVALVVDFADDVLDTVLVVELVSVLVLIDDVREVAAEVGMVELATDCVLMF